MMAKKGDEKRKPEIESRWKEIEDNLIPAPKTLQLKESKRDSLLKKFTEEERRIYDKMMVEINKPKRLKKVAEVFLTAADYLRKNIYMTERKTHSSL